jgi:predicted permease
MRTLGRLSRGLMALLRWRRADAELDEELRSYQDMAVADRVRRGLDPDDALRASRRDIGSLEAVKERTRDAGWEALVVDIWCDARYAVRTMRRSPAFATVATLVLALGIGANTAIFTIVNAVMLRPLPVERPGELFVLASVHGASVDRSFSFAAYRQFAAEGAALADVFAASSVRRQPFVIDGPPEPVNHQWVSGNYFTTLGVAAALGRTMVPLDESDRQPVAVLSDAYWARRFGRDSSVVGRVVQHRGAPFTVIGVAPHGFFGESVGESPDMWLQVTAFPQAPPDYWTGHSTGWLRVFGRRRPDVPLARAHAGFEPIFNRVRDDIAAAMKNPEFRKLTLENRLGVSEASGGNPVLRERFSAPLTVLLVVVGVVLTIACANVANLLLARAAARRREIAVRLAIGAGPVRLVRQGIVEALVMAAFGGAVALLIATWAGPALVALLAGAAVAPMIDAGPDARVFAFTAAVSAATAVLFGLWPAFRAGRTDPLGALKDASGPAASIRFGPGRWLVTGQVALSFILLVGAGLFIRTLMKLEAIDAGFNRDSVLLFQLAPTGDRPLPPAERREVYRQLMARAQNVPGVAAVSASAVSLFIGESWGNLITVEGLTPAAGTTPRTFVNAITPHHFDVMQIALVSGRVFTVFDHESAPRVAIVNQTFARQFFGESDPLGKRVGFGQKPEAMIEVVGVVRDAKYNDLLEANRPMLYVPFTQHQQPLPALEVRVAGDPAAVAPVLRRELAAADGRIVALRDSTLRQQVSESIAAEHLIARLSAVFGVLALLLAAVGLYGVMAYVTAQRTSEIGVRMALGASARDVRWLVLRQALLLVVAGLIVGIPTALAAARLVAGQLYGVAAADPLTFGAAAAVLSAVAMIAAYLPARRAARVDPLIAFRCE